jgi:chromosome partitioning protein
MIGLFSHQKGGVGKSTSAINVVYAVKNRIKDIAILDLDSQHSTKLFNELRKQNGMECVTCYTQDDIDLDKLIVHYKNNDSNLLIVDSGGYDNNINRKMLINADLIITPVGISQIEIFGLQKFRKILQQASKAIKRNVKTHILLNNVDARSKKSIEALQKYVKSNDEYFTLLETILHTRTDYKSSYGDGLTVKEYNKKSKATKEIKSLSKEIEKLIFK